jgi:nucleotide-binding universal stress UspA family protein
MKALLAITTNVVEGTPRELIVQQADDRGADLIGLDSHRQGPLRQALFGSVASGVAADAAGVVEIIRAGRPALSVYL